jgi:hypothetical protein
MITYRYKRKLLTKWFLEWVNEEEDYETLELSRQIIEERQDILQPKPTPVIGFQITKHKQQ